MQGAKSLNQLAEEIGEIVRDMRDAGSALLSNRLLMGQLLAEAKRLFKNKKEFFAWCEKHVIRSNGKPYSPVTIDNYIMFATVPGRYQRERDYHSRYQSKERATVQEHRWDGHNDASRYQSMLALWRASTDDDRIKFVDYLKSAFPKYFGEEKKK